MLHALQSLYKMQVERDSTAVHLHATISMVTTLHLLVHIARKNFTEYLRVFPGVLGSIFAGYVPLASRNPYPIIVYSVANYRPHLSHFGADG